MSLTCFKRVRYNKTIVALERGLHDDLFTLDRSYCPRANRLPLVNKSTCHPQGQQLYKGPLYKSCQPCPWGPYRPCPSGIIICHRLIMTRVRYMKKSACGLNIYDSEKMDPRGSSVPHPVAICIIFKHQNPSYLSFVQ